MGRFLSALTGTAVPVRRLIVSADQQICDGQIVVSQSHIILNTIDKKETRRVKTIGTFSDNLKFWDSIRQSCYNGRKLFIVCEDLVNTFTGMGFFDEVEENRLSINPHGIGVSSIRGTAPQKKLRYIPLQLHGESNTIGAIWDTGSFVAVDPRNFCFSWERKYYIDYLNDETFQRLDGLPWDQIDLASRCEVLQQWFDRFCSWWMISELGKMANSISGSGFNTIRRYVKDKKILIHDCESAAVVEDAALFGGRQQLFFSGLQGTDQAVKSWGKSLPKGNRDARWKQEVYDVDFRSCYLSLMRDHWFPVRFIDRVYDPDRRLLLSDDPHIDWIIQATVALKEPVVPLKRKDGIHWPIGTFNTCLTKPEYQYLLRTNQIAEIRGAYRYHSAPVLREYAEKCQRIMSLAELLDSKFLRSIVKYSVNSATGKLAQRQKYWKDRPDLPAIMRYGFWQGPSKETGKFARMRSICGRVQELVDSKRRKRGSSAIYAKLTALARMKSFELFRVAGHRGVLYWDTDGGIVTRNGLKNLQEVEGLFGSEIGQLRLVDTVSASVHRGIKRYWRDGRYQLSGVPAGYRVSRDGSIEWDVIRNPVQSISDPNDEGLTMRTEKLAFREITTAGTFDESGWLEPVEYRTGLLFPVRHRASSLLD